MDPRFHQNWHEMRAAEIYRGAYHFFLAAEDPVVQAKHFVKTVGELKAHDLPPMLDVEITDHTADEEILERVVLWL